jgi:putative membrane protein
MKKHLFLTLITMATLVGTAGLLRAIAGPTYAQQQPLSADAQFLMEAAEAGAEEVALAELALQRSASDRVKAMAAKIAADRRIANTDLETVAGAKNIRVSSSPSRARQESRETLEALAGAAFDRAWTQKIVTDHEAAVDLFTQHSKTGADAEVRAFAGRQLPALRAHLKQAHALLDASAGSRARR